MSDPDNIRILALETSTRAPSVALLRGSEVVAQAVLSRGQSTASALVPLIDQLLTQRSWARASVELIGVCTGPGSFTGLRVGTMLAKTWAFAAPCQLVGVSTFEVLAEQAGDFLRVAPVIPAQRGQVFAAVMQRNAEGRWEPSTTPYWFPPEEWAARCDPQIPLTGPGVRAFQRCEIRLPSVTEEVAWDPRAETVGKLALAAWKRGQTDDPMRLAPIYLRPSAAEEKRSSSER